MLRKSTAFKKLTFLPLKIPISQSFFQLLVPKTAYRYVSKIIPQYLIKTKRICRAEPVAIPITGSIILVKERLTIFVVSQNFETKELKLKYSITP